MHRSFLSLPAAILWLAAASPAQLVLNEVLVDPVGPNAGRQIVEIANISGASFLPTGWVLAMGIPFAPLPNVAIPADGHVRLHIGASGTDTATDFYLPSSIWTQYRDIQSTDTLTLFRTSCVVCDGDIVDFVSFGGGTDRIFQAVGVNEWSSSTDTVTLPTVEGASIAFKGGGNSPAAWFGDATPTLGADNGKALILLIGAGCATGIGTPWIVFPGPAVDGSLDFSVGIRQGVPNAPAAMFLGLGGGGSVPFLGCPIETTAEIAVPFALDAQGSANLAFPLLAPGVDLGGVNLFFQGAVIDVAAPNGLFGATPGGRLRVGH